MRKRNNNSEKKLNSKKVMITVGIVLVIAMCTVLLTSGTPKYNITFDENGGSLIEELVVKKNGTITKPEDPTKENYVFAGWYLNDEIYDFSKPVLSDITLIAKWVENGKVVGVTLDSTEMVLNIGDTVKLNATITPEDANDKSVTWESSNPDIVSVDSEGNIFALQAGNSTITVTTNDGNFTAKAEITVKDNTQEDTTISVIGIVLDRTSLTLTEGDTSRLIATINPSDATDKNINWKSSNSSIVSVDSKGNIKAIKPGSATITVTTIDGGHKAKATITVNAKPVVDTTVSVTGVSLNRTSLILTEGDSSSLTATVNPSNATNKNVTWASSNSSVVTVDMNGNIKAIKAGTATITVTTEDGGHTAQATIAVNAKPVVDTTVSVTGVSLNKTSLTLTEGDSSSLTAIVSPNNATNKNVTWASNNSSIVSVDQNGNIKALKAGNAIITVTTKDGGHTAQATITVKAKPVIDTTVSAIGVSLNKTSLTLTEGDSSSLTAIVSPSNATNKNVTWASSNSSVVSVDQNGNIKAIKAGSATITVTTKDGGHTAQATITVKAKPVVDTTVSVTGVSLNKTSLTLTEGDSSSLTATINPSNATNKNVTWASSNSSVVTVDANGNIKAIKTGSATITVTTKEGNHKATCEIVVNEKPVSYKIIFTPEVQAGTGAVLQYSVAVTKNNSSFNNYSKIIYNGRPVGSYLSAKQYNKNITSATIILSDGNEVTATVVYK